MYKRPIFNKLLAIIGIQLMNLQFIVDLRLSNLQTLGHRDALSLSKGAIVEMPTFDLPTFDLPTFPLTLSLKK